ncbi:DUF748 domain-containing protein [Agaribacterium haliotis]|uniref:DUF748 domain-containing protein n=1 Tax=Agaribacterium haliotis TaxID=2013869 RepID=UPI000BB5515C|nr:DUF748 domain-containing protein [Agaribacterium haliotis]
MFRRLWARLWFRIVALLVAAVLTFNSIVWLTSPMFSRYFIGDLIESSRLELDQNSLIRLNLFRSRITIENLRWQGNEGRHFLLRSLDFDFRLLPLLLKEFEITRLSVDGVELHLQRREQGLAVAGFEFSQAQPGIEQDADAEVSEGPNSKPAVTGLSSLPLAVDVPIIELSDIQLFIDDHGHQHKVVLERFRLQRAYANREKAESALDFAIDINDTRLSFDSALDWKPSGGALAGELDIQDLNLEPYRYLLPESLATMLLSSDVSLSFEFNMPPSHRPKLLSEHFRFTRLSLALNDFELQLSPWQAAFEQFQLDFTNVEISKDAELFSLQLPMALSLKQLELAQLQDSDAYRQLLALDSVEIPDSLIYGSSSDAHFKTSLIDVGRLIFSKPDDEKAFFDLSGLALQGLDADQGGVELHTLLIKGFELNAIKDENGQWKNLLLASPEQAGDQTQPEIAEADAQEAASDSAEQQNQPEDDSAFYFKISRIALENASPARFHDASTTPIFDLALVLEELELLDIDSQNIDQVTTVKLATSDGEYYKQELDATWQLFHPQASGKFELLVEQFPLYKVSPMLKDSAGFDIMAGELDLDYRGEVKLAELDSQAKLFLRGPIFSSGSDDHVSDSKVAGQAAIPMNYALGMLKDRKGNIKLKLNIDGDINDPSFDFSNILIVVLRKQIFSMAQKELAKQFIPYGQLLGVAMAAGNQALKVRFSDLTYVPGSEQLDSESAEMAEALRQLLVDKEKTDLRLCPVATAADIGVAAESKLSDAQHHKAILLAQSRAAVLKKTLVEQGISSERLLLCAARYDSGKNSLPRIEIKD